MDNAGGKGTKNIRFSRLGISGVCKKAMDLLQRVPHYAWLVITAIFLALFLVITPHNDFKDFWAGVKDQRAVIALTLSFCLIALSLLWSVGQKIDVWTFMLFNMWGSRARWLDWGMLFITQTGSGLFAGLAALVFYLTGSDMLAYELMLGTLTLWLIVEILKTLIRRDRPFLKLKDIRIIGPRARGHSFPSGHTSQAFFNATLILHYFNFGLWAWVGMYLFSFIIGITRIYVGMHYPRDVAGGAALGTAWGIIGVVVNCYIWGICPN